MFQLLHLLGFFLYREAKSTATGGTIKTVTCEHCASEYVYWLQRSICGEAAGFLIPDKVAARAVARQNLCRALAQDCDPVPCPACGLYQRQMVQQLKRLRHQKLLVLGEHLLPLSVILGVIGLVIVVVADGVGNLVAIVGWGMLGFAGLALLLGISLPIVRFVSGCCLDPNSTDEDLRRIIAQARAFSLDDLRAGEALPSPQVQSTQAGNRPPKNRIEA
jgi:hypothetical protein